MQSKGLTTVAVVAVIVLTAFAALAYLLYAIPQSNADSLSRKVTTLRNQHSRLADELAAANRRAAAADRRAAAAFAKGRAEGLARAASSSKARYDAGYAAGSAAAFGPYGNDWSDGAYLVMVQPGTNGKPQITARAALQECQAVYAQNGSVYIQGPAC